MRKTFTKFKKNLNTILLLISTVGRPEGPIKTFALRGIKDTSPYLRDGRLPTLHDAVEFFDLVLELELNRHEKEDLVAYLLCL